MNFITLRQDKLFFYYYYFFIYFFYYFRTFSLFNSTFSLLTPTNPQLPLFTVEPCPSGHLSRRWGHHGTARTQAFVPQLRNDVEQRRNHPDQLPSRTASSRFRRRFGLFVAASTLHLLSLARWSSHLARSRSNDAVVGLLQLAQAWTETHLLCRHRFTARTPTTWTISCEVYVS